MVVRVRVRVMVRAKARVVIRYERGFGCGLVALTLVKVKYATTTKRAQRRLLVKKIGSDDRVMLRVSVKGTVQPVAKPRVKVLGRIGLWFG